MTPQNAKAVAEAQVKALIESWIAAAKAKDVDAIMRHYTDDILSFDAVGALQFKGQDAYRKHWKACLEMCPGEGIFEIHELGATPADDVAFAHYVLKCGGKDENGVEKTGWMRATVCLRKQDGKWLIQHEHYSMPMDMATGTVMQDAQP